MDKLFKTNLASFVVSLTILYFFLYMEWFWVVTALAVFATTLELLVTFVVLGRCKRIKNRDNLGSDEKLGPEDVKYVHMMLEHLVHNNAELSSIFNSIVRSIIGVGLISFYGLNVAGACYLAMVVLSRIRYQSARNLFIKN